MFGILQNLDSGCFGKVHPNVNIDEARRVLVDDEPKYNELKLREALDWIRAHPRRFLKLCTMRSIAFWLPPATEGPYSVVGRGRRLERLAIYIMTFLSLGGLFILCRRDRKSAAVCTMCLVLFPLTYYIVQYDYRYRYPILWVTFLLGALPITTFAEHIYRSLTFGSPVAA